MIIKRVFTRCFYIIFIQCRQLTYLIIYLFKRSYSTCHISAKPRNGRSFGFIFTIPLFLYMYLEVLVANLKQNFKHGFGTLATQFLDDQMLVSGGHDGVLRYWDLRQVRLSPSNSTLSKTLSHSSSFDQISVEIFHLSLRTCAQISKP